MAPHRNLPGISSALPLRQRIGIGLAGTLLGMLLLASGQFYFETRFVGTHAYQVLMFVDRPYGNGGADFEIFIDAKHVPSDFVVRPSGSAFAIFVGTGPVFSTKQRVTLELVPRSKDSAHRVHRFEIESQTKKRICDAVIEVRGGEPTLLGCSNRAYEV